MEPIQHIKHDDKEEPSDELIEIGLNMGCEYMLAYHKLIVEFVSLYRSCFT